MKTRGFLVVLFLVTGACGGSVATEADAGPVVTCSLPSNSPVQVACDETSDAGIYADCTDCSAGTCQLLIEGRLHSGYCASH